MSDPVRPDELFYIDQVECVSCGACQAVAPDLIEFVDDGHGIYRFKRQPENPGEEERAIAAINGCCVSCIYYRGDEPAIKRRIADFVVPHCHHRSSGEPTNPINFNPARASLRQTRRLPLMFVGSTLFAAADLAAIFDPRPSAPKLAAYLAVGLVGAVLFLYARPFSPWV